ncbi:hypothetical protein [Rhizobium paranaense]|uniref:DUF2946 domain-containing protein n=1 Tax=Rhizobium paranaense TaxID=1650438 RepID=A0A7W8XY26_9HYPH|nr:hypothetical protein [Rhizobium paranaense]MBB5577693.1 hypothetical protein [Rhizobium paranaense]
MKKLRINFVQMLLVVVGFLATLAVAVNIPDVPSGTGHDELYGMVISITLPDRVGDCAGIDHDIGSKQKHLPTKRHKCCHVACAVYGFVGSLYLAPQPRNGHPFFASRQPMPSPSDPRDIQHPPNTAVV